MREGLDRVVRPQARNCPRVSPRPWLLRGGGAELPLDLLRDTDPAGGVVQGDGGRGLAADGGGEVLDLAAEAVVAGDLEGVDLAVGFEADAGGAVGAERAVEFEGALGTDEDESLGPGGREAPPGRGQ